jgi:hypothetical protein
MKLLDTNGGNTKLSKNNKDVKIRVAGLSLYPNDTICAMRNVAECAAPCLVSSGRGGFTNVELARQAKTDFYMNSREQFIAQLVREIELFERLCAKQGVECYIRLNVISDIRWELEQNGAIPQLFPNINFFDYTKIAKRLDRTPANYQLMFSYSRATAYQAQVAMALKTSVPMSVVFYGPMPDTFMGKPVVNGDASDIENLAHANCVIGLKYKVAKGKGVIPTTSVFIVNTNIIPMREAA